VNLYIGNTSEFNVGKNKITLQQETNYPWDETVKLTVKSVSSPLNGEIRLRIPGWCKSYSLSVNGEKQDLSVLDKGYAVITKQWNVGDRIELAFLMPVEVVTADPNVKEDTGKRAIQRGPLVYCVEEADNKEIFEEIAFTPATTFNVSYHASLLNGVTTIVAAVGNKNITMIPYYAWDNREAGEMKVWVDYVEKEKINIR
jgi:DUF1680 family protein